MKLFSILALAIAAVSAQEQCAKRVGDVSACARQCIEDNATKSGCAKDDFKCFCGKQGTILAEVSQCVSAKCTKAEFEATLPAAQAVCTCLGTPFTVGYPGGKGHSYPNGGGHSYPKGGGHSYPKEGGHSYPGKGQYGGKGGQSPYGGKGTYGAKGGEHSYGGQTHGGHA